MGCEQQQLQDSLQHLQTAHDRQKELCNTYSELERLLPMMLRTEGDGPASASVEVCPGVHMQAEIPSTDTLFVDVGLGFSVECAHADALRIAQLRQAHAQRRMQECAAQAVSIQAAAKEGPSQPAASS